MTSRIYIACLASYNNGVLHGEWIDATADADEMQEEVNAILRASKFPNVTVEFEGKQVPSAEEFAIHDTDDADGILTGIGEGSSLKDVARCVETAEHAESELGEDGPAIVAMYWDHVGGTPSDAQDAVEQAREAYAGQADTIADWAAEFLEDTGGLDAIPESLRHYFDYEAWARDADIFSVRQKGTVYVFWSR